MRSFTEGEEVLQEFCEKSCGASPNWEFSLCAPRAARAPRKPSAEWNGSLFSTLSAGSRPRLRARRGSAAVGISPTFAKGWQMSATGYVGASVAGSELHRHYLRFRTKVSPVALIFFIMFDSVSINFERRSIAICKRIEVISDISFMLSS